MLSDHLNFFKKHPCSEVLVLDKETPEQVARATIKGGQKQPFYIFNMDEMYKRIQHFKKMLPRVHVCYAVKSNDADMVLKLAAALGIGFDCASPGEIYKILELNVKPKYLIAAALQRVEAGENDTEETPFIFRDNYSWSIIYAVPTKAVEQIMYARSCGVRHTMFDTSYELTKIKQYWPDARLLLRIRVDGDSAYNFGEKFGCDYETEAIQLLDEAAELGLCVVGVGFHVGSYCSSTDSHIVGLKRAKSLFDYEQSKGRKMKIVDIGGGFYSDDTGNFDVVCNEISRLLDELFPEPNEVQVLAEPGRYLCDTAFTLYCNTNNVKKIINNDVVISSIYMNDGLHGTLNSFEPWYTVEKLEQSPTTINEELNEVILWGPTVDSRDRVTPAYKILMADFKNDDWLVFKRQGAYTLCATTKFVSLETSMIRPVVSYGLWMKIKECTVFNQFDFDTNPDIYQPLPMLMPTVLKYQDIENDNFDSAPRNKL